MWEIELFEPSCFRLFCWGEITSRSLLFSFSISIEAMKLSLVLNRGLSFSFFSLTMCARHPSLSSNVRLSWEEILNNFLKVKKKSKLQRRARWRRSCTRVCPERRQLPHRLELITWNHGFNGFLKLKLRGETDT